MGRPTRKEQERRRIEANLAEGKDENGDYIVAEGETGTGATGDTGHSEFRDDAKVKVEPKIEKIKQTEEKPKAEQTEWSVGDLEQELEDSEFKGPQNNEEPTTMASEDISATPPNDETIATPKNPYQEPIIENESDANNSATGGGGAGGVGPGNPNPNANPEPGGAVPETEPIKKEEEKGANLNSDLDDLSPTEKRKQVEMFAETILTNYAQLLPVIFKSLASYNMGKMEILDREGSIRLTMVVGRDEAGDLTIKEHFLSHNEQVDAVFVITDDMKDAIREPLIAVLMEKGIAPTPMTTLLIAVGGQMLQFGIAAYQMMAQKTEAINQFKAFRKEELESRGGGPSQSQTESAPSPASSSSTEEMEITPTEEVTMEDIVNTPKGEEVQQPVQDDNTITIQEVTDEELENEN